MARSGRFMEARREILYIDGGYIRHDTRKPSKYGKEH